METELFHSGRKGMKWYQHIFGEHQAKAKYAQQEVAQIKLLARTEGSTDKEYQRKYNRMSRPGSKASMMDFAKVAGEYSDRLAVLERVRTEKIDSLKRFYEGREALRKMFEGNDWFYDAYPAAIKKVGHEKIDAVRRALSGKK